MGLVGRLGGFEAYCLPMRLFSYLLAFPLLLPAAEAATAYFAFQSGTASGSPYQGTVTSNVGFASNPTISKTNGAASSVDGGGQTSFADPNNPSNVYEGNGSGVTTVNSYGWNVAANDLQSFTGAAFTVTVNMTGLTDLNIAFGLRAAGDTDPGYVPLSFKAIEYSIGGSGTWTSVGVASPTWAVNSTYSGKSVDLSALNVIEGASDVQIRFSLADSVVIPTGQTASSIRIDNLVLTAVPEPSMGLLALFPALAFGARRRR